jgi:hypothetical protein
MPNCDFYAAGDDFTTVISFVFKEGCRIFESYSPFEQALIEFRSFDEIAARYPIGACRGNAPSTLLSILAPNAGGDITVRRVTLDPRACDGATYRYVAEGWGLIQLHLGGIGPNGLVNSHTNHSSERRAAAWEQTRPELGSHTEWNWNAVTQISSRINRQIRSHAADKRGSRVILPAAAQLLSAGIAIATP